MAARMEILRGELDGAQRQIDDLEQALAERRAADVALREQAADAAQALAETRARAAAEQQTLAGLHADYAALQARFSERGILVTLGEGELRFAPGAAALPAMPLTTLEQVAEVLSRHPELNLLLRGHTDSRGDTDLNRRLSAQRAQAVRKALIGLGIGEQRIRAEGAGADEPIADNGTADGRGRNRRVELYLTEAVVGA